MIAEYNTGNVLQARHVFGPGADEVLVTYDASGNRNWLVADERGSIVARTDASGAASAIRAYDEFGIPTGGDVGRFQYTGQAWLPELGMSYFKARMYSHSLGRFMQPDPIGYGDGMNRYAYVGNDPVNKIDPTGLVETELLVTGRPSFGLGGTGGSSSGEIVVTARPSFDWQLWNSRPLFNQSTAFPLGIVAAAAAAPAAPPAKPKKGTLKHVVIEKRQIG